MAIDASFDSPGIFRRYIERNARYALSLIKVPASQPLSRKKLTIAFQALQYTLALPELWAFSKQLLLALAPQMELLDLRVLWLPYLKEGLRQSLKQHDEEAELSLRYYLGNFLREANAYDEAIEQYTRGMVLAEERGDVGMKVRLLNRYAFALRRKGELDLAEEYANLALSLAENDPIEQGYSNLVLGAVRYDQRRWDSCLTYASRALEIWLKHDAGRDLAWAYTNLGVTLWRKGELEDAKKHLESGIRIFEEIGDIVHQASAKMNMGAVLIESNEPEQALSYLAEAEKVFHAIQDKRRMAMVANNLAHVYQMMGIYDDALDAFQQSVSLWQAVGEPARALNVLHSLISLLLEMGEIQHAQKLLQEAYLELASIEGHPDYDRLVTDFEKLEMKTTIVAD